MLNRPLKGIACTLAACALVFTASAARADDMDSETSAPAKENRVRQTTHIQLGARSGYGYGVGSVYKGFNVTKGSYGYIPVVVDLGLRVFPELYIGVYGSWAHVIPKTNDVSCPEGFDCSINNWRFGVQVDWHFRPRSKWDPYLGFNAGYEILHNHVTGTRPVPTPAGVTNGDVDAKVTDRGFEFIGLTLGSDFRCGRELALGPFISASFNQYNHRSGSTKISVQGTTVSDNDVAPVSRTFHGLGMIGLRGTLNL